MRVLGIDPSSTSLGWAFVTNNTPVSIGVWTPKPKSAPSLQRLVQCAEAMDVLMRTYQPDELVIEVIRVSTSHDTTRILSRVESAALIAAHRHGVPLDCIHEHQVGEARAAYFNEGNIGKHEAHDVVRHLYPHLPWLPKLSPNGRSDGPGLDQSDALIAALARDKLAARPKKKAQRRRKSG